jgi:arginyl-tRNA synthetase
MIKQHIEQLILTALKQLPTIDELPAVIQVDAAKDKSHGDYASNIALIIAKASKQKPREMADQILKAIVKSPYIGKNRNCGPWLYQFLFV